MAWIKTANLNFRRSVVFLLLLGLWAMLLSGLQAGDIRLLRDFSSARQLFDGLRSLLPLLAGASAVLIILVQLRRNKPQRFLLFGPLGLTVLYAIVGLGAAALSPDKTIALYWAAAYVSVPLVLWAIAWRDGPLDNVKHLINFNWLIVSLAVGGLFATALIYLHLGTLILTPSSWFDCSLNQQYLGSTWIELTSGILRPTGVGRYAAIAAIVALAGMWQGKARPLWGVLLLASLILLLSSGARGALMGFAAAAVVTSLLYGGKKAVILGVGAIILLAPVAWVTGIHQDFAQKCLRVWDPPLASATLQAQTPPPTLREQAPPLTLREQAPTPTLREQAPTPTLQAQAPPLTLREQAPPPTGVGQAPVVPQAPVSAGTPTQDVPSSESTAIASVSGGGLREGFFKLSGRTSVWADGWDIVKGSPLLGRGFHADRIILGTHMHNAYLHALVQTGFVGLIAFVSALLLGWVLLLKLLRRLAQLPEVHKHLVIQSAAMLAFFSVRSIPESTGAFFGVDWLLLAPVLLYLQVVNHTFPIGTGERPCGKGESQRPRLKRLGNRVARLVNRSPVSEE